MTRYPKHLRSVLVILTGGLILWSCTSTVEPEPTANPLHVDTTNGHTEIDTAVLRDQMEGYAIQGRDNRDIPFMIRLVEAEEMGTEAIAIMLNTYDSGIEILVDIAEKERSQAVAVKIIIDALDIDDPYPEPELGEFLDSTVSAVWNDEIAEGKHANAIDALVAITRVFEFQLKQVIDARPQLHSRAAKYAAEVMYGMNANHFRSMCRYLRNAGIPYSPAFLTQEEFDEETTASNYLQLA